MVYHCGALLSLTVIADVFYKEAAYIHVYIYINKCMYIYIYDIDVYFEIWHILEKWCAPKGSGNRVFLIAFLYLSQLFKGHKILNFFTDHF